MAAVKYDVLILSMAEDFHAQAVMEPWQRKALGAKLFNLSEFSMRLALSLAFEDSRRRLELRLRNLIDPDGQ